jgi:large subunit ribosomal protein L21
VLETGGFQFKIKEGQKVKVPKLAVKEGDKLKLEKVLLIADGDKTWIGSPYIENVAVEAEVAKNGKLPKIIVFKKKRRREYRRTKGHRQQFTELLIRKIPTPKKG